MSDTDAPHTTPRDSPDSGSELANRLQSSRTLLGILLAFLICAVLLALWFLLTGEDDEAASETPTTTTTTTTDTGEVVAVPTVAIPASTPTPEAENAQTLAVPTATVVPTAVPEGFEACGLERSPIVTATYIVDTLTTPLNQRAEPSVQGALVGSYDPGQTGITFTGECVVNLSDGYVWWETFNGSQDVWVASDFVTPN